MELAVKWGRAVKPDLLVGICGEHGGHPAGRSIRATGIDHAGKPFDRYGIDLYEVKDGKIALKDSYLKAE